KFVSTKSVHATEYELFIAHDEQEAIELAAQRYSLELIERQSVRVVDGKPDRDSYRRLMETAFDGGPIPIWRDPDVL
ncbi:hypothetical protein ACSTLB_00135, partial [Vibrio parahaemolyticus]